jgi:very-short-patch-repair endonuclease
MRNVMTRAEVLLWNQLRRRQLGEFRFNRQVEIGPDIVDFVCREKKLIVEVDGATHGEDVELARDRRRTVFLQSRGFRVVTATNMEVYNAMDVVLERILAELTR